jgi:hypothetical protein
MPMERLSRLQNSGLVKCQLATAATPSHRTLDNLLRRSLFYMYMHDDPYPHVPPHSNHSTEIKVL